MGALAQGSYLVTYGYRSATPSTRYLMLFQCSMDRVWRILVVFTGKCDSNLASVLLLISFQYSGILQIGICIEHNDSLVL